MPGRPTRVDATQAETSGEGGVSRSDPFAAERFRSHQTIPPTTTAAARIAKATQPHSVLVRPSSSEAAAAAAAAAAGLTPSVVVTVTVAATVSTVGALVVAASDSVTVSVSVSVLGRRRGGFGQRHCLRHRWRCFRRGDHRCGPGRQRSPGQGEGARPGPDRLAVAAARAEGERGEEPQQRRSRESRRNDEPLCASVADHRAMFLHA